MKKYSLLLVVLAVFAAVAALPHRSEAVANPASGFCAKSGGTESNSTSVEGNVDGACSLPGGVICKSWDLYRGACPGWPPANSGSLYDENGRLLHEGDLISAAKHDDPDIYIIKFKPHGELAGYKRLFLNPIIFSFYGHLGGFSRVHPVSTETRDLFETTGLFRNCETNSPIVWATETTGEDAGVLHHVNETGEQAQSEDGNFFHKVFCINNLEERWYNKSNTDYTHLRDLPVYRRHACLPRPACLDATSGPRCLLPEPADGWCPRPLPIACLNDGESYTRRNAGKPQSEYAYCCTNLQLTDYPAGGVPEKYCAHPGCYYRQDICSPLPCNPVLVCPPSTPEPAPHSGGGSGY